MRGERYRPRTVRVAAQPAGGRMNNMNKGTGAAGAAHAQTAAGPRRVGVSAEIASAVRAAEEAVAAAAVGVSAVSNTTADIMQNIGAADSAADSNARNRSTSDGSADNSMEGRNTPDSSADNSADGSMRGGSTADNNANSGRQSGAQDGIQNNAQSGVQDGTQNGMQGSTQGSAQPDTGTDDKGKDEYTGFLRVQVYTASGAYPVPNALVTVSSAARGLINAAITNSGGQTEPFVLPAPAPGESFRPGEGIPYELYSLDTTAPGFYGVKNLGVAVYPGITTIQRVELIPVSLIGGGEVIIDEPNAEL